MATEQKLDVTDDNPFSPTHDVVTSQHTVDPPSELPTCCHSDTEHRGAPVTHPVTSTSENGNSTGGQLIEESRTGSEGQGSPTGDLEIIRAEEQEGAGRAEQGVSEKNKETGEETGPQETGEEKGPQDTGEKTGQQDKVEGTGLQVTDEETSPQVTDMETGQQVTGEGTGLQETGEGTGLQVTGWETGLQVTGWETGLQVTGWETGLQVTDEETGLKATDEERELQVTGEETGLQVTDKETGLQETGEETGLQVASEETDPQKTVEDVDPQVKGKETSPVEKTDIGGHGNVPEQETNDVEKWIDMLVEDTVTEVFRDRARTIEVTGDWIGIQVETPGEVADAGALLTEEGTHSNVWVIEEKRMTDEQVTEGAGAAVYTPVQVSDGNADITLHVSREGAVEVTGTPEELSVEEAGGYVNAPMEETAGEQVCATGEEVKNETASKVEAGGQVKASGEEAGRELTPDLVSVPGREGTVDPERPTACREKEWPPLICTGREVRADTAEQGETQQGTEKELCHRTPDMKERETVQDGETPTPETPIEREIRLTMEREMTLRQERGISLSVGQPELVEVRRKTITVEPVALAGKERQLAGAQMQREIQLETRREQDLVELGKVMGTYDRGRQQELQEKKMIFESLNTESSDPPIKKNPSEPQQSKPPVAPTLEVPVPSNHVAPATESKKGPSYAEANGSNVIIIEHSSLLRRSAPGNASSPASAYSRRSAPADPHRSAPADPRRSAPAESSYANSAGSPLPNSADSPAPGSPFQLLRSPSPRSLLEREIEEVQEREQELRRQRSSVYGRDDNAVETSQTTSENKSDIQSGIYQPERPSWGRLEVNWPPNTSVTMNGEQEQVLDSPRTRRQRSALITSWESGNPNPRDDE